jgi:hypothetical protein
VVWAATPCDRLWLQFHFALALADIQAAVASSAVAAEGWYWQLSWQQLFIVEAAVPRGNSSRRAMLAFVVYQRQMSSGNSHRSHDWQTSHKHQFVTAAGQGLNCESGLKQQHLCIGWEATCLRGYWQISKQQ